MSDKQAGKGDRPRPYSIDHETYENNWERTFGKNRGKTCMYSGLPHPDTYNNLFDEVDDEQRETKRNH
jgi:hypothetical protein